MVDVNILNKLHHQFITPIRKIENDLSHYVGKCKDFLKKHRSRVLSKYENDFNFLLKVHWPKLTSHYVDREYTQGNVQLGTQPKKAKMINELMLDTCHIQKMSWK